MAKSDQFNLSEIDLNLLVTFQLLMEERNVTRVASLISRGQPAVSAALARLRQTFGDPLFVRTGAGLSPTPAAERLNERLAPVLAQLRAAVRLPTAFDPQACTQVFAIALQDDFIVEAITRRFRQQAPQAKLRITRIPPHDLEGALHAGAIELAISARYKQLAPHFRSQTLIHLRYGCLFRPSADDGPITLDAYLAADHVLVSFRGDFTGVADEALAKIGRSRTVKVVIDRFTSVPFMVKTSGLVATLPDHLGRQVAAFWGLRYSELPFDIAPLEMALFWHHRMDDDPAHSWFRTLVADAWAEAMHTVEGNRAPCETIPG